MRPFAPQRPNKPNNQRALAPQLPNRQQTNKPYPAETHKLANWLVGWLGWWALDYLAAWLVGLLLGCSVGGWLAGWLVCKHTWRWRPLTFLQIILSWWLQWWHCGTLAQCCCQTGCCQPSLLPHLSLLLPTRSKSKLRKLPQLPMKHPPRTFFLQVAAPGSADDRLPTITQSRPLEARARLQSQRSSISHLEEWEH